MNLKGRRRFRLSVSETKASEFTGDGKASVFGGGIGIDSDEKVLRIENARLETKVFATLDLQAQAACVIFRIDGNAEVPMLVGQSPCGGSARSCSNPSFADISPTPYLTVLFRPL